MRMQVECPWCGEVLAENAPIYQMDGIIEAHASDCETAQEELERLAGTPYTTSDSGETA